MSGNKKKPCLFVNLAEQIAKQNDVIGETMDGIVEQIASEPDAAKRSDWSQIQKTAETVIVSELTVGGGERQEDIPKPKSLSRKMAGNQNNVMG